MQLPAEMPTAAIAIATASLALFACARRGAAPGHDVHHVSVTIDRPRDEVYAFASDPRNLPKWADGLARSDVKRDGDEWLADSPMGSVRIRFAENNPYGVLDHDVRLPDGTVVHNPMRVVPHGAGSEVTFTLIRRPGVSDEALAADRAAVEKDLRVLKTLLEGGKRTP